MQAGAQIEELVSMLAKLPGLGPRSARRAALFLLQNKQRWMLPLAKTLQTTAEQIAPCEICGNLDSLSPCQICRAPERTNRLICVVEQVGDVWAMERARSYNGHYHVLGGTLSPLDGVGPDDLRIASLLERVNTGAVDEVILALNATIDGQTTAHYVADRLKASAVRLTRLAHGVPIGGELDYLDEGTLATALHSRKPV